jgi:hypothetical protein
MLLSKQIDDGDDVVVVNAMNVLEPARLETSNTYVSHKQKVMK